LVFSDTSGKQGLVEDTDYICGTDSTSYPLADKARNANRHYYKAVIDILKVSGRVQFDDSNHTTLPEYTFTLVDSQKDYSLPTNLLKLWAIEVRDTAGNWTKLSEVDIDDMKTTITDFEDTPSIPRRYDLRGDSAFLHPAPASTDVTLTNGGKMYFSREIDGFTYDDTTQEPGFAEPFHRIVSLGMSYDWLLINGTTDKTDRIRQEYEQLRTEMRQFYGDKNRNSRTQFRPALSTRNYL